MSNFRIAQNRRMADAESSVLLELVVQNTKHFERAESRVLYKQ